MTIVWNAPSISHPDSSISVDELAKILESKYNPLHLFQEHINSEFLGRLMSQLQANYYDEVVLNEWLKNKWREWILDHNHSIISRAAMERGDPPLVNTGTYFKSLVPTIQLDNMEARLIKTLSRL